MTSLLLQSDAEYLDKFTAYNVLDEGFKQHTSKKVFEAPHNITVSYPDSLDWRTKGAVGGVKNQVS